MQQLRFFLIAALLFLVLMLWSAWERDYGTGPTASESANGGSQTAQDDSAETDRAPSPGSSQPGSRAPATQDGNSQGTDKPDREEGERITVSTDLLELEIRESDGAIATARLKKHTVEDGSDTPFTLMSEESPLYIATVSVVGPDNDVAWAPGPDAEWSTERSRYRLKDGDDRLVVPMRWQGPDGTQIVRRYVFRRDSYVVHLEHEVTNPSDNARTYYNQTELHREPVSTDQAFLGARSFTGAAISTPEDPYVKYDFSEITGSTDFGMAQDPWIAMLQHYFLVAALPPTTADGDGQSSLPEAQPYLDRRGTQRVAGLYADETSIASGETAELESRLFIGPKEQGRLDAAAHNLEKTVDYGIFYALSKPLFNVLNWIHGWVGNWGWSIMILVLMIKILFYKLSEKSYRSMARMRKLQPKMQEIRERYSDDKQRMNQEIMELYKKEQVNPLGGCLPILIQIPVFIALYWVLLESVELRHAPWVLWITDLGSRDPLYILPVLMGVSMFLQQKLNPAPMDPVQEKVMMALPFVFTIFFAFFPAGLVLYWVTNNSLSILQQWVITRRIESEPDDKSGKGGGSGGGLMVKLNSKLRELQDKAEQQRDR